MTRVLALTVAALAVAVTPGAAANSQVTISARPAIVGWGEATTLAGIVEGGNARTEVVVQAKECGVYPQVFRDWGLGHIDDRGVWSTETGTRTTTEFRITAGGKSSAPVTVRKRPFVQLIPRSGRRFEVAVAALSSLWRRHVEIERFDRRIGRWRTVRTVVLTDSNGTGEYVWSTTEKFRVSVPKGTALRAVLPLAQAKPCYLAGHSKLVTT